MIVKQPPFLALTGIANVYQLAIVSTDRADRSSNELRLEQADRYARQALKHIETMRAALAEAESGLQEMINEGIV